jgi:hypothetical protein
MTLGPALEIRDRVKGLNEAARLVRLDKSRWEGPALAGIFHAEAKAYSESAKALDEAGRLAPPNRRANIELAAAAARNEAAFGDQVRTAGLSWEKQEYEVAAKAYEAAWKTIPTRIDTGMQAATGYLMADQVAPAVEMLTRVRDFAPAAVAGRMSGMLRELGAISEAAKAAAVRSPASESAVAVAEPAAEIRALVGALSSPEVELVVRAAAPLLRDTTFVTGIPDEEISGGGSDVTPLPTDSIFAMYQRDRARTAAAAMVPVADLATQPAAVGNTYDVMVQSKTRGLPIFVNGQPSGKATPALLTLDDGDTVGVELSGEMHRGKFEAKEGLFLRFPW